MDNNLQMDWIDGVLIAAFLVFISFRYTVFLSARTRKICWYIQYILVLRSEELSLASKSARTQNRCYLAVVSSFWSFDNFSFLWRCLLFWSCDTTIQRTHARLSSKGRTKTC